MWSHDIASVSAPPLLTEFLWGLRRGDALPNDPRLRIVYELLRRTAIRVAGSSNGATMRPSDLLHDAWLRLFHEGNEPSWRDRGHFFAAGAAVMRHLLIDSVRRTRADKHGGKRTQLDIDELADRLGVAPSQLADLEDCLDELGAMRQRCATIVQLLVFCGMSLREVAAALHLSDETVRKDREFARAWLAHELRP